RPTGRSRGTAPGESRPAPAATRSGARGPAEAWQQPARGLAGLCRRSPGVLRLGPLRWIRLCGYGSSRRRGRSDRHGGSDPAVLDPALHTDDGRRRRHHLLPVRILLVHPSVQRRRRPLYDGQSACRLLSDPCAGTTMAARPNAKSICPCAGASPKAALAACEAVVITPSTRARPRIASTLYESIALNSRSMSDFVSSCCA